MKLLALILALASTLAPGALLATPSVQYDAPKALEYACYVMQYDCSEIELPQVVVDDSLFALYGAWGQWDGELIRIDGWIGPYMTQEYMQAVLTHEMTHYLDAKLGYLNLEDMASRCRSEWNGWRVSNAYLVRHDMTEYADFDWAVRYGCFQ